MKLSHGPGHLLPGNVRSGKETWLVRVLSGPADFLPFNFVVVCTPCAFGMKVGSQMCLMCLGVCRLSCFNALTPVQHACREVLSNWFGNHFSVVFFKPLTFQHWGCLLVRVEPRRLRLKSRLSRQEVHQLPHLPSVTHGQPFRVYFTSPFFLKKTTHRSDHATRSHSFHFFT